MKRTIRASTKRETAPLEELAVPPAEVCYPLDAAQNRCALQAVVETGDRVAVGVPLATGEHLAVHASVSGRVEAVNAARLTLRREDGGAAAAFPACPVPDADGLPGFARDMGLVGMGGSLFPGSIKLQAAKQIHTLVINAVECEPGIQIDEVLLRDAAGLVRAGVDLLREALGISKVVLAVKRPASGPDAAFAADCEAALLAMPDRYPGGAEKLLLAKLEGRMPPAGQLPVALGYLVFSVASLWALGRRVRTGEPSILRPLTLVAPQGTRNVLVPVGTPVGHVLDTAGMPAESDDELLIAGGLMMGRRVTRTDPVLKGTNALFVQPVAARLSRPEQPCIQCGSCFDGCPLGLHPIGMADRIRAGRTSRALEGQLNECFLCGACSAVCPSDIPLVQIFQEEKACRRANK